MSYDEEFYEEPSEFEMQIDEFKQTLLKSIKSDYVAKMERLEKENAELQGVKSRMKENERERARKMSDLENSKRTAMLEAKKMRLGELLKDYKQTIYKADSDRSRGPKCDKCDEERKIPYITPLGREAKENCTCAESTVVYKVKEVSATSLEHYSAESGIKVNYYDESRDEVVRSYQMYEPGVDFEKVNPWTYFSKKEECQKYCDWLTEKESKDK